MNESRCPFGQILAWTLCLVLIFIAFWRTHVWLSELDPAQIYYDYEVSEWMISYEGGFVRRGLMGQLLWWLTPYVGCPLYVLVRWVEVVLMVACVAMMLMVCWRRRWYPVLTVALIVGPIVLYRRDFLMLLMAFGIYWLGTQELKGEREKGKSRRWWVLIALILAMVVAVLSYEPSFFFIVPVCMLIVMHDGQLTLNHLLRLFGIFILPIAAMVAVCVFKGNEATADAIWASWLPYIDIADGQPMGVGVDFLKETTESAIRKHLVLNYGIGDSRAPLGVHPVMMIAEVLMLCCLHYLVSMIPFVSPVNNAQLNSEEKRRRQFLLLSDLYMFQMICLLPMMTVLSCDFGRTSLYFVFSTIFLAHLLEKNGIRLRIPVLHSISVWLLTWVERWRWLRWWWLYLLVMLAMPFNFVCGTTLSIPLIRSILI